ncbi:MAG: hypothetical protein CML68_07365 [Rhodobacteraceae bacterium]|nr:hypothetical protein [Paracoccaceae bacterium]
MIRSGLQAVLLSALLVLTGQALAHARGAPLPVGLVQLCTGSGPVMVQVDADGQPVDAPHYCPEGALSLLQAVAFAPPLDAVPARLVLLDIPPVDWSAPSHQRLAARARAPPGGFAPAA